MYYKLKESICTSAKGEVATLCVSRIVTRDFEVINNVSFFDFFFTCSLLLITQLYQLQCVCVCLCTRVKKKEEEEKAIFMPYSTT